MALKPSLDIKFGQLFTGKTKLENAILRIRNGSVSAINEGPNTDSTVDLSDYTLVPGFIDIHTHGYYGVDSCNSTDSEVIEWTNRILETGVTSLIPALVSLPLDQIYLQFHRYSRLMASQDGARARILGLRCEGPYLSMEKKGAHNPEYLRTPHLTEMEKVFREGSGILKIIDIAPELADFPRLIKLANEFGVRISVGHSNASFAVSESAFREGASLVTHFYNAMSSLTHKDSGLVGAGLLDKEVVLELIADLHHVPAESIEILVRMRGLQKVALITDSLSIGGAKSGIFELGGLPITQHDGVAWIGETDTIAGSVLTMDKAVRNLHHLRYSLQDLVFSTSGLQAGVLGLERTGYLEPGFDADICVLDDELNVVATIVKGELAYKKF